MLHGWPGYRTRDLIQLGVLCARAGQPDGVGWPSAPSLATAYRTQAGPPLAKPLPSDPGVLLGNFTGISSAIGQGADVVVSLCRMGTADIPRDVRHVELWLIDDADPLHNPNIDFILADLADSIGRWRDQGRKVFVHCVAAQNRTPLAGAAYLVHHRDVSPEHAIEQVIQELPPAILQEEFHGSLARLRPREDDLDDPHSGD
jgi:hypothetical protein